MSAMSFGSDFFLNGNGTAFAGLDLTGVGELGTGGGGRGDVSSSSPSSGDEVICRLIGLASGEAGAIRL